MGDYTLGLAPFALAVMIVVFLFVVIVGEIIDLFRDKRPDWVKKLERDTYESLPRQTLKEPTDDTP